MALRKSIEEVWGSSAGDEAGAALAEAQRRDAELSSGTAVGRTHEQVLESMRRATECA